MRQEEDGALLLTNVIFALEDTERFEDLAMKSWLVEGPARPFACKPCPELGLSEARTAWLMHIAALNPNWHYFAGPGPWNGDARAIFMLQCLDSFAHLGGIFGRAWRECQGELSERTWELIDRARFIFKKLLQESRSDLPSSFLPNAVLLVEGLTESILMPALSPLCGVNLDELGVFVQVGGGAKQVAKRYLWWRDVTRLPLVSVLDADAGEQAGIIHDMLRQKDRLHVLASGELEDTFADHVVVELMRGYLDQSFKHEPVAGADTSAVDMEQLQGKPGSRVKRLQKIWKERAMGSFDKVEFARYIAHHLDRVEDVPDELKIVFHSLEDVVKQRG